MSDRLAANRANSLLSTGPRTEDGKRKSSLNAVKTGLTGVTVLLYDDDAAEYQRHIAAYQSEFQPVGLEESNSSNPSPIFPGAYAASPGLKWPSRSSRVIYTGLSDTGDPAAST